ncbi:unnamed protein product [Candida verbasci]|uniref:Uncharacterized protein n=1 Tax=Candida verbasci TaxID=1227364 RepID=A0A9W4XIT0_9ASCO|nr:unnamed protein product [Candida verbasci]
MNSVAIRVADNYYKLEFTQDKVSQLAIPSPSSLKLQINLILNDKKLNIMDSEYNELIYEIANRFKKFFTFLSYNIAININENDNDRSFGLDCSCQVFNEPTITEHLRLLTINLYLVTSLPTFEFDDLIENWNYLLSSWYLYIETQFPFCFSYIGRSYTKMNLFWYKKLMIDVFEIEDFEVVKILEILYNEIIEKYTVAKLLTTNNKLSRYDETFKRRDRYTTSVVKSYPVRILKDEELD